MVPTFTKRLILIEREGEKYSKSVTQITETQPQIQRNNSKKRRIKIAEWYGHNPETIHMHDASFYLKNWSALQSRTILSLHRVYKREHRFGKQDRNHHLLFPKVPCVVALKYTYVCTHKCVSEQRSRTEATPLAPHLLLPCSWNAVICLTGETRAGAVFKDCPLI